MTGQAETCITFTGRDYPPGYGFAIDYMPNANSVSRRIWRDARHAAARHPGDPDTARFKTVARRRRREPRAWLIEACQAVLQTALKGNDANGLDLQLRLETTLRKAGHPGF